MKIVLKNGVLHNSAAVSLADVSSANIVGYSTLEINKSIAILAINFENVAGGSLPIQQILPKVDGMTAGNTLSAADNIQVMKDDGTYEYYYLSNGYNGKSATPATTDKWVNNTAKTVATPDTIANGKAFWYVSRAFESNPEAKPYNITVAGQVLSAEVASREIALEYMLVANPYPCDVKLNGGVNVTKGATYGNTLSSADNLQIMNSDGTYAYYYLSNGYNGKSATPATENKWVNNASKTIPTEDSFPAGRGAWFVSRSSDATVEFVNPVK